MFQTFTFRLDCPVSFIELCKEISNLRVQHALCPDRDDDLYLGDIITSTSWLLVPSSVGYNAVKVYVVECMLSEEDCVFLSLKYDLQKYSQYD